MTIVKNTKLVEIIEESTLIKGIFYYNDRIGEDNKLNRIIGQKELLHYYSYKTLDRL